jgi:hypothetical protein
MLKAYDTTALSEAVQALPKNIKKLELYVTKLTDI